MVLPGAHQPKKASNKREEGKKEKTQTGKASMETHGPPGCDGIDDDVYESRKDSSSKKSMSGLSKCEVHTCMREHGSPTTEYPGATV